MRILCRTAILNEGLELPPEPFVLGGRHVHEWLRDLGRDGNDRPLFELEFDCSREDVYRLAPGVPSTNWHLHHALALATRNPSRPHRPERIGLLFAARYAEVPGALGAMFDRGWDIAGETPVPRWYHRVSREGCAVFVETIRELRAPEGPGAIHDELAFTVIHELGHVFGLGHQGEGGPSFMTPSRRERVRGGEAWGWGRTDSRETR